MIKTNISDYRNMNVIQCLKISITVHVNLYECKQSHVSDVLEVRMASIGKFSGNLITKSQYTKTIVHI